MKVVLHILFILAVLSGITSCSEKEQRNTDQDNDQLEYSDYFFPSDSLAPYIYVYADENRPVDEKFYRVYKLSTPEKEHMVVERYNASFRITEGFTYDLNNELQIVDHMIVDAKGKKRKANLTKPHLFPSDEDGESLFISDFPAHIDSMLGVYKSSKKVVQEGIDYEILGHSTKAVKIKDEVTLSFVNPFTEKGSSNTVDILRIYAKGFGLTEWYSKDKKVHFKLKRILSNEWWEENAQGPVIRGAPE